MPGLEHILPEEKKFNTVAHDYSELLYDYFQEIEEESGDILDPSFETRFLSSDSYPQSFATLSRLITPEDTSNPEENYQATYRGFVFGAQLADLISDAPTDSFSLKHYFGDVPQEELGETIQTDVQEYLGKNPLLDATIGYYMPELDPTGKQAHIVETAAGLALRVAEDNLGRSLFYSELNGTPEENPQP